MSQPPPSLAILFADISGSTALYDKLGDEMARRLVARCLSIMSSGIAVFRGTLVKTLGDEIMCTFPSAEAALHAACAMQHAVESGEYEGKHPMHIRIGFNYGEVICESGDVFGDTVNIAARVAAITRASQIMTTQAAVSALPPDLREKTRQIMRAEFKGKQEQLDISIVIWEMDDMLSTRVGTPVFRKLADNIDEMTLRYHEQSLKINKERRSVILGRGEICDIVIQNGFASRQHTRIELRFGKFILADQSTNGTYIRFSDGNVVRLAREEMILRGSGSISLGQAYSENPADLIEFSVTTDHARRQMAE